MSKKNQDVFSPRNIYKRLKSLVRLQARLNREGIAFENISCAANTYHVIREKIDIAKQLNSN